MPSLTMGYRNRDRQRADLLRDGRLALKLANGLHSFAYIQAKVGGSRARLYRAMKAAREADLLPGSVTDETYQVEAPAIASRAIERTTKQGALIRARSVDPLLE